MQKEDASCVKTRACRMITCVFFVWRRSHKSALHIAPPPSRIPTIRVYHQPLHLQQSNRCPFPSDLWHAESQYATSRQSEQKRKCLCRRCRRPQFPHIALTRTRLRVTSSPFGILLRCANAVSPHIILCTCRWMPALRLISHLISQLDIS